MLHHKRKEKIKKELPKTFIFHYGNDAVTEYIDCVEMLDYFEGSYGESK